MKPLAIARSMFRAEPTPVTREQGRRLLERLPIKRENKFKAKRTSRFRAGAEVKFDSMAEACRYDQLALLERAGEITGLELQPRYRLDVNGQKVCSYVGDFRYVDRQGREIVEDVKSPATKTSSYRIKKKLLLAIHGIEIIEIMR